MRNPEFQRNLWLEFSSYRVLATAMVLLIFFAAGLAIDLNDSGNDFHGVRNVAIFSFYILVLFWGGRQAAGAVVGEIRNRTWDSQRMSSLGPWAMAWGKLFGATAFTWSAGLVMLVIYAAFSAFSMSAGEILAEVLASIALGVVAQAVGLLATLVRFSALPGDKGANVTLAQLVGLLAGVAVYYEGQLGTLPADGWYGLGLGSMAFLAISSWFFAIWCVVGVYRRMRITLLFSNGPGIWLLFLLTLIIYAHGLTDGAPETLRLIVPTALVAGFLYLVALAEPKNIIGFRRMVRLFLVGRWIECSRHLPLWLMTYKLLVVIAVLSIVYLAVAGSTGVRLPSELRDLASAPRLLLAILLFATRDLALLLWIALRRPGRAVELETFIYWFVLYVPIPAVFFPFLGERIWAIFYPTGAGGFAFSILPVLIEVAVVVALLASQWWLTVRRQELPVPASQA